MQCCRSVTDPGSADPYHWLTDPDPVSDPDPALFVAVAFKVSADNKFYFKFFCLLLFESTFSSFFKDKKSYSKEVRKQLKSSFFLLFLWKYPDPGGPKLTGPTDPDPQHLLPSSFIPYPFYTFFSMLKRPRLFFHLKWLHPPPPSHLTHREKKNWEKSMSVIREWIRWQGVVLANSNKSQQHVLCNYVCIHLQATYMNI